MIIQTTYSEHTISNTITKKNYRPRVHPRKHTHPKEKENKQRKRKGRPKREVSGDLSSPIPCGNIVVGKWAPLVIIVCKMTPLDG